MSCGLILGRFWSRFGTQDRFRNEDEKQRTEIKLADSNEVKKIPYDLYNLKINKDFDKETEKYSFTSKGPGSRYKSGWSQLTKKK